MDESAGTKHESLVSRASIFRTSEFPFLRSSACLSHVLLRTVSSLYFVAPFISCRPTSDSSLQTSQCPVSQFSLACHVRLSPHLVRRVDPPSLPFCFSTPLLSASLPSQSFQYNPLAILRICKPHGIAKCSGICCDYAPARFSDASARDTGSYYWRGNYPIIQPWVWLVTRIETVNASSWEAATTITSDDNKI